MITNSYTAAAAPKSPQTSLEGATGFLRTFYMRRSGESFKKIIIILACYGNGTSYSAYSAFSAGKALQILLGSPNSAMRAGLAGVSALAVDNGLCLSREIEEIGNRGRLSAEVNE